MAVRSGFFNAVNDDRVYDASNFAEYFATFIGNGVFPNPSNGLQVYANNNMTTVVKAGKGWINGYFVANDSDFIIAHDRADGVLKRIDRIVLRKSIADRDIQIVLKKGTYASNPAAPVIVRDADYYELALADVLITNGAIQITQANITDQRLNTSLCGIVHGTVNQVDTTTIYNQYQTWYNETTTNATNQMTAWQKQTEEDFMEWFNSIQDILNENVAANLASRITVLEGQTAKQEVDLKAHVGDIERHNNYGVATGTNALTLTLSPAPKALTAGLSIRFKNPTINTGPMSLNVNGLGVKAIKRNGNTDVLAGEIKVGVYTVCYDGTAFILQGEGGVSLGDKIPNSRVTSGWRSQWTASNAYYGGSFHPAVDKDGNVYIISGPDSRNNYTITVTKYSKTGTLLKQITMTVTSSYQPNGLNVSPDGSYVVFTTGGLHTTEIHLYNSELELIKKTALGNFYMTASTSSPVVNNKGEVYIALLKYTSGSSDTYEVKKFAKTGYEMWLKSLANEIIVDLILLSDGNIAIATDRNGMKVHKITGVDTLSNVTITWSYLTDINATRMGNLAELTNGDIAVAYITNSGNGNSCWVQAIMTNGQPRPAGYISLGSRLGTQYYGMAKICSDGNGGVYFGLSIGFYWSSQSGVTVDYVNGLIYGRLGSPAGPMNLAWCHIYSQNTYSSSDAIGGIEYDALTDSVISTHSNGTQSNGNVRKWDWYVSLK